MMKNINIEGECLELEEHSDCVIIKKAELKRLYQKISEYEAHIKKIEEHFQNASSNQDLEA